MVSPNFNNTWQASKFLWKYRDIVDVNYVIEPIGFSSEDFKDKFNPIVSQIKKTGVELVF